MEAYPDKTGRLLLGAAGVELMLIEGVRSRSFNRVFSVVQATKEREAVEKVRDKALARHRDRPASGGS